MVIHFGQAERCLRQKSWKVDVCDEETKEPIVYEHNGNEYTMTEIDYHLGKVIEKMNC